MNAETMTTNSIFAQEKLAEILHNSIASVGPGNGKNKHAYRIGKYDSVPIDVTYELNATKTKISITGTITMSDKVLLEVTLTRSRDTGEDTLTTVIKGEIPDKRAPNNLRNTLLITGYVGYNHQNIDDIANTLKDEFGDTPEIIVQDGIEFRSPNKLTTCKITSGEYEPGVLYQSGLCEAEKSHVTFVIDDPDEFVSELIFKIRSHLDEKERLDRIQDSISMKKFDAVMHVHARLIVDYVVGRSKEHVKPKRFEALFRERIKDILTDEQTDWIIHHCNDLEFNDFSKFSTVSDEITYGEKKVILGSDFVTDSFIVSEPGIFFNKGDLINSMVNVPNTFPTGLNSTATNELKHFDRVHSDDQSRKPFKMIQEESTLKATIHCGHFDITLLGDIDMLTKSMDSATVSVKRNDNPTICLDGVMTTGFADNLMFVHVDKAGDIRKIIINGKNHIFTLID